MKKLKWNYLTVIAASAFAALTILLIYIIFSYIRIVNLQKQYDTSLTQNNYRYHCAFIAGSPSSSDDFWASIYASAKEEGRKNDIYLEKFGSDLSIDYTTDELLKMAIAAKVDAILIEPTGKYSTTYLINSAIAKGIPVGTLYSDDLNTTRYNYTGVNSVSLGYDYGSLAISNSEPSATSVMVLLEGDEYTTENRLMISGIGKALSEQREDAVLDTLLLHNNNSFELEEQIRTFLKDNHDSTDIIICTNLLQSQYVSQAAVDLNYVGDFTIIGTYQNATTLEYLKNNVISACVVINSSDLGQKAVSNLAEYLAYGHASDYSQINAHTITTKDASRLLKFYTPEKKGGTEK